jgi:hypothetical protein
MVTEVSLRFSTEMSSPDGSSRNRGGEVFPMRTSRSSFSITFRNLASASGSFF